ncbi:conjugal transfer protein TraH [Duganella vulcania]|uniref:Conjugal transfer protein TraH n=1 Tax=Duganella vulcania TaxID=2692166 RepID=A0A845GGQ9_9BURK|nr:conjugal transfer protein TraH [Duganella vulcania]MYM92700.1 hypothetical protein [Duganella vulcania]
MNRLYFYAVAKWLVCVCALLAPLSSKANLQNEMQSMFHGMVNVTSPNAYVAQGRGVLTGGSINMRFRTMAAPQIGFVAPSMKGGCNGIDMFGGSLSFISMDQFIQLSKTIAQNAAGYAFGLAMEGLCPTCAQEMKSLQKIIQNINNHMISSCDAAKKILHGSSLEEWALERKSQAENEARKDGYVVDQVAAKIQSAVGSIIDVLPAATAQGMERNVVWKALWDSNASTWFASGDGSMLRMLMNVTGTAIIRQQKDADGNYQYLPKPYRPLLKFGDILNGVHNSPNNLAYKCNDDICLDMAEEQIDFVGMKEIVNMLLFGAASPPDMSDDLGTGIISKINKRGSIGQFTDEEKSFIAASRPPILALLRDVASDPAALKGLATSLSEVIAIETTAGFIIQSIDAVEHALIGKWSSDNEHIMDEIKAARADAYREMMAAKKTLSNIKEQQDFARFAAEALYRSSAGRMRSPNATH